LIFKRIRLDNDKAYKVAFKVRDYECDLQGVVNNANYQHYLEHARHEFLLSMGVSFSGLHDEGIDLIVTRVEIDYKYPLRSRNEFIVKTAVERDGHVKLVFRQEICLLPEGKTVVLARVTGIASRNGRPVPPGRLIEQLGLGQVS
jgi:acyl-CoA thioester hydrolase